MGIRDAVFQPVDALRHQVEPVTPIEPVTPGEEDEEVEEVEEEEYLEEQPIEYSGFVIVRLLKGEADGYGSMPVGNSLREEAARRGFERLIAVLEEFNVEGERLIQQLSPAEIASFENPEYEEEESGRETSGESENLEDETAADEPTAEEVPSDDQLPSAEPPSLNLYWRVDVREDPARAERLVAALRRLSNDEGIGHVYREMKVEVSLFPAATNSIFLKQRYLHPAPLGIDVRAAWDRFTPGQTVNNVRFADVEEGWFRVHTDLPNWLPNVGLSAGTDNPLKARHGASVLGILMAQHNAIGIFGQTTGLLQNQLCLASNFYNGHNNNVAAAIAGAALVLNSGDVLLIEVERSGRPVELDCADFAAIYRAVQRGIIVVEAAGNGNVNLDNEYATYSCSVDGVAGLSNSGAIMVGACNTRVNLRNGKQGHSRASFSSYGQRVDCHAWGSSVLTTDDTGDVWPFDGTSAAAAIIAGAVVVLQSLYKAGNPGQTIAPAMMRTALKNPLNGTPQVPLSAQRIGSMPNLPKVVQALNL